MLRQYFFINEREGLNLGSPRRPVFNTLTLFFSQLRVFILETSKALFESRVVF